MEKKVFDIGEEFQVGLVRLKCVAQRKDKPTSCEGCFFHDINDCSGTIPEFIGGCASYEREDSQDVIFVKI